MNTSVAVKIFLTRFVKTGKFPFEIETIDHQPNEETLKAFKETDEMINQGNLGNNEELQAYFDRMKKGSRFGCLIIRQQNVSIKM